MAPYFWRLGVARPPNSVLTTEGHFIRPHAAVEKCLRCVDCRAFLFRQNGLWGCPVAHGRLILDGVMRQLFLQAQPAWNRKRKKRERLKESNIRGMFRLYCAWATWRCRFPHVPVEGEHQALPFPSPPAETRTPKRLPCRCCRERDRVVMRFDPDPPGGRLFVTDYCSRCRLTLAFASSPAHRHRLPPNDF